MGQTPSLMDSISEDTVFIGFHTVEMRYVQKPRGDMRRKYLTPGARDYID